MSICCIWKRQTCTPFNHSLLALDLPGLKVERFFQANATSAEAKVGFERCRFGGYYANSDDLLTGDFALLPDPDDPSNDRTWGNLWVPSDGFAQVFFFFLNSLAKTPLGEFLVGFLSNSELLTGFELSTADFGF